MTSQEENTCNSNKLPVELLTITTNDLGVMRQVKALDSFWVEDRKLTLYEHPPNGDGLLEGALEVWRTRMQEYLSDLKWLLAMEHHKFWSTVIYHSQCMDMLVSFLQEANPPYMEPYHSIAIQGLYEDIRKLVLIVFSRLITNKESKSCWMSKEYMGNLIYDKFLFTIPIIWDISLVYGGDNCQHVSRLLTSVFTLQPKYTADLEAAIEFVKQAFSYIILQVNKTYGTEPANLRETFKGFREISRHSKTSNDHDKLTFATLKDLVIHLLDTVLTLRIFAESYPSCVEIMKKQSLVLSIVHLYEYAVPHLYERLDEVGDQTSISYTDVQGYIDAIRAEFVDLFREILAMYKNYIFSGGGNIENHIEEYLAVIMEGLSEKLFIKDYHSCYPIHEDLELLRQACPNIDNVKTDFILQAIYSNLDEPIPQKLQNNSPETSKPIVNGHETIERTDGAGPSKDLEIPDNIKEESLISEVRDILPHLGDGFILKCLHHYGFNSERVINSILEDTLDDSLRCIEQSLPIIPEDILDNNFLETGIARLNVFDGDEFDIMTRDDVDVSRIHVGKKKSKYKDIKEMLDDKSIIKQREDIYNKYNLVCDEEGMYSDEYDDTYDDEAGVVTVGDSTADDLGRPFVTPRALQKQTPRTNQQSSSSEEEDDGAKNFSGKNSLDFCTNPEEIRARREAQMRMRNNKGSRIPPVSSANVVGKPKGQGQEHDVVRSRDNKEKHKSAKSNHNRRQGAQWKRSRGMMPS